MTWQTFWSIAAAAAGFMSAVWFGYGSTAVKASGIVEAADESWDAASDKASALIVQSAQYLAGALLLLVSFALQVVVVQASTATVPVPHPIFANPFVISLPLLLGAFLMSTPFYAWRKRRLESQVRKIMPAYQPR